jgi:hypothetical protein
MTTEVVGVGRQEGLTSTQGAELTILPCRTRVFADGGGQGLGHGLGTTVVVMNASAISARIPLYRSDRGASLRGCPAIWTLVH